ncbi:MAG: RluA family pseudouridine synthase, partial [Planctomycetota bacterium]
AGGVHVEAVDDAGALVVKQFEDRTNLKCYLALVHGCPDPPSGAIDQPLGKHPTIREGHAVRHDGAGKESLTYFRVRRRYHGYSLIECELKSGRTHQIRVHLSYHGFPIVGDQLYGGETVGPPELVTPPLAAGARPSLNFARSKAEGQKIEAAAAARAAAGESPLMGTPALHAALLRIDHPIRQKPITFTAPLHPPMLDVVRELEAHHRAPGITPGPVVTDGVHIDLAAALPGIALD